MARNSLLSRLRKAWSIGDQLQDVKDISINDLPAELEDYPKLQIKHSTYIPERWLHHKRSHTSWICLHGCMVVKLNPHNHKQGSFWVCSKKCDMVYAAKATSSTSTHLNKIHILFKKEDD
ncbi:hypothetical protein B0T25DRAFT_467125 [Lasiosphaeria hispida]|uniref:Uncharacterized protein n=1 Tax=Lasiosphaeria hispida TaxID=260671 RepID=A0AAJ0H592_9PEZI|nr:hypothetical protein B0T25DRAFT_467125 [Lasiosphaeria hispida]